MTNRKKLFKLLFREEYNEYVDLWRGPRVIFVCSGCQGMNTKVISRMHAKPLARFTRFTLEDPISPLLNAFEEKYYVTCKTCGNETMITDQRIIDVMGGKYDAIRNEGSGKQSV